jgi:hypothetical protein
VKASGSLSREMFGAKRAGKYSEILSVTLLSLAMGSALTVNSSQNQGDTL